MLNLFVGMVINNFSFCSNKDAQSELKEEHLKVGSCSRNPSALDHEPCTMNPQPLFSNPNRTASAPNSTSRPQTPTPQPNPLDLNTASPVSEPTQPSTPKPPTQNQMFREMWVEKFDGQGTAFVPVSSLYQFLWMCPFPLGYHDEEQSSPFRHTLNP